MSYLVLARKWRPQTFEEVIGQKPITQALQNAIAQQRVAHAYLFAGPRGVGKTSVARILAKALNCQEGPTPHPCDHCPFCQEIRTGIAVDVVEIDGASNRGIDEIRELRENVRYLPAKNKFKVYIIDEVHMLTDQAFNALLKTLEEPPPHVIFIFATTEAHKIPLTILSRCQRYNFKRIPIALTVEQLKKITAQEGMEISDRSLHLLAREAEGSLRDGQSLLDQVLSFSGKKATDEEVTEVLGLIDRRVIHGAMQALAEGDKIRLLQTVEEIHTFGYDLKEFCGELARMARDFLVLKVFPQASVERSGLIDLPQDEIQELSSQGEKFSLEEIHSLFQSLLAAHDEIARSAFPRLVLEMTLIRMARRKPIFSVEEALERLRNMEERLSSGLATPLQPRTPIPSPPTPAESIVSPSAHPIAEEEGPGRSKIKGNEETSVPPAMEKSAEMPEGLAPEIHLQWKAFVQFAKRKKPPLASLLEQGYPLSLNEELLEIGYPHKSFFLERMQEVDNRSVLSNLCLEFFQRKMTVHVAGMKTAPLPAEGPEENQGGKNSKKNQEEEAVNHPLVKEAINIFGGRVMEIKRS
jgi:DNA polymerase-3 subunit gamma/tau